MIAAAPEGSPPRRISNKTIQKILPAVPRRGPEAGFHRIHYDFLGFGCEHSVHTCFSRANLFPRHGDVLFFVATEFIT